MKRQAQRQGIAAVAEADVQVVQVVRLDKLLYTVPDAARLMGISPSKLWPLVMGGAIGSCKIGAARRVPATAIARFIEENQTGGMGNAA